MARTAYEPGGRVQDDFWFPPAEVPLGHGTVAAGREVPPVLVMASGYSRWMLGLMIPSRHAEDLVLGTWRLLQQLGGVPRQLVWDNEGGVGKFRGRGRPLALSRQFAELPRPAGLRDRGAAAAGARAQGDRRAEQRLPGDLVPAGPVIRLAGGLQRPAGRVDGAGQLPVQAGAGVRAGGPDRCRPGRDGAAAAARESSLGWHNRIRLPRDHYVRIDTCDYSVDPAVIGRMVDVRADLDQVTVTCEGRLVGLP